MSLCFANPFNSFVFGINKSVSHPDRGAAPIFRLYFRGAAVYCSNSLIFGTFSFWSDGQGHHTKPDGLLSTLTSLESSAISLKRSNLATYTLLDMYISMRSQQASCFCAACCIIYRLVRCGYTRQNRLAVVQGRQNVRQLLDLQLELPLTSCRSGDTLPSVCPAEEQTGGVINHMVTDTKLICPEQL